MPTPKRHGALSTPRGQEVLRAAAEEFYENGFKATRLSDIASRVGMRTASLYYYIDSKEDLLLALLESAHRKVLDLVREDGRTRKHSAPQRLRSFIASFSEATSDDPPAVTHILNWRDGYLLPEDLSLVEDMRRKLQRLVEGILEQGISEGQFDSSIDVGMAARTLLLLLADRRDLEAESGSRSSLDSVDWFARLFLHGLGRGEFLSEAAGGADASSSMPTRRQASRQELEEDLYWDPFDFALHADPHPVWRRMREEAPLYYNQRYDFWALTRFQDVLDALSDWKTYSSSQGDIIEVIRRGVTNEYVRSLILEDPPSHTVHRQLMNRAFTPNAVRGIQDRVRSFAQRTLDEQIGSGGFDFVDDFGARIPGMVIAAMIGTPDSDLDTIRELTCAQIQIEEGQEMDQAHFDEISVRLGEYFMEHVRARRKRPTDDIMSALVTMELTDEDGVTRKLTDMEACQYIFLLSSAGNETAARFAGWAGSTLALYPEQRAKLVSRPDLIANGVEEVLRYEPPTMALARVLTKDVVLHDQLVPEGAVIVLVNAATGRDQRHFPNPDVLDVERSIDRHLSFGFGIHVCMGISLARLEARIVLEECLARFPEWDVEWDKTELVHTGSAVRGYSRLPITIPRS